ncbi:MAG: HEAT repeat domain-containing protein [Anaerolineae bacterium]|nr:HEAT repeat domain-containing protein [Anaerolineae bacterium]
MTTSTKRIIAYHIARLQDKNRDVRLKSIAELILLPDRDSLDALKQVVEKDSDNEVRRAALEAGRTIFLHLKQQEAVNKS